MAGERLRIDYLIIRRTYVEPVPLSLKTHMIARRMGPFLLQSRTKTLLSPPASLAYSILFRWQTQARKYRRRQRFSSTLWPQPFPQFRDPLLAAGRSAGR